MARTLGTDNFGIGRIIRTHAAVRRLGRLKLAGEIFVELIQHFTPGDITFGDTVKFSFHLRRETIVEQVFELLDQPVRHQFANLFGIKTSRIERDVTTFLNGRDDGGIGRRSTDPAFFQFTHQARLTITWRRFGKVLNPFHESQCQCLAGAKVRQHQIFILARGLRQNPRVAIKYQYPATQSHFAPLGLCSHRRRHVLRIGHLARHKLTPDQIVKPDRIILDIAEMFAARAHIGGTNGFVCFLRVFFTGIKPRFFRQIAIAKILGDIVTATRHRFTGQIRRVGSHVGDVPCLVKALCHRHRLFYGVAEPCAGGLLQGRRDEGCTRARSGWLVFPTDDGKSALSHADQRSLSGGAVVWSEVFFVNSGQLKTIDRFIALA